MSVVGIVCASLWATLSAGQDPQHPTFRSRVDLVEVDVVAVDSQGHPVRGLSAADFTLFDRKKREEIATFQEVTHQHWAEPELVPDALAVPKRDVASNRTAQSDRLVVLVVDDLHIFKGRTDRTKDIARTVVRDLGSQASMGVLFTSGDHNLEVTQDRAELVAAIDQLKGRRPYPRPILAVDDLHDKGPEPTQDIKEFYDDMNTYKTLQDAARLLAADDGRRKAFVFITEGIAKDLSGIFDVMGPPGDIPQGGVEYARTGDAAATIKPAPVGFHALAIVDMMDALRRANVAAYIIDPRGEVSGQDLARECHPSLQVEPDPCLGGELPDWYAYVRQAQHGLEMTAAASGGFAITNTNDFTKGLGQILDDLDHYYLLGFYPADPTGRGYRQLDVKVNRPGITLRFRQGYVAQGQPAPPKTRDPLTALSAGVLPRTDLALRLTAVPGLANRGGRPSRGSMAAVPSQSETPINIALEVSVPKAEVTRTDGQVGDALRYTVLAADLRSGKTVKQFTNTAKLTSHGSPRGETLVFQFPIQLSLPAGRYQLRASATSEALARGGSVYLALDVSDTSKDLLVLSGLTLAYGDGPHVTIASGPMSNFEGQITGTVPTLDRDFSPSDTLQLSFEVASRTSADVLTTAVEILTGDRVIRSFAPTPAHGHVDLRIPLSSLSAGAYLLRATVRAGDHLATHELPFAVK